MAKKTADTALVISLENESNEYKLRYDALYNQYQKKVYISHEELNSLADEDTFMNDDLCKEIGFWVLSNLLSRNRDFE